MAISLLHWQTIKVMTTQKKIDEIFIDTLENVIQLCEKITPGNVAHYVVPIKGRCQSMIQFYRENSVTHWHSVKDGDLPKKSGRYIVMAQNGYCHTCQYCTDDRYWDTVGYQSDIKYWMEIPELPTE
ncbi:MAG: hypothetical protein ACTTI4_00660 [Prevotella fusca]|uniref:hypothetical protein n=1 Tax=Prevotella fusca TaxID=589436 RepID=UPI003F9EC4E3